MLKSSDWWNTLDAFWTFEDMQSTQITWNYFTEVNQFLIKVPGNVFGKGAEVISVCMYVHREQQVRS